MAENPQRRADLIRWLCIDRVARELVDPRGIRIRGARITEPLDLSFANVPFLLDLWNCRLEQYFDLQFAKMPMLNLEGSSTGPIAADGIRLESALFLRYGFHAEDEVRLRGATIGGDLDAEGGTFKNLKSDKNPDSTGYALSADGIKVTGAVLLRNGFSAEGEVRLPGATIGGGLDAQGGTFKNLNGDALKADGITVTNGMFLRDEFVAEGAVRLVGAEIKGQLVVDGAWLDELNLVSAQIAGPFFLAKHPQEF